MKIDPHPVIAALCEKFPAAFFQFEQRRRPLKLGIHKDILAAMPAITAKEIHAAMRYYTSNEFYCRGCIEGAARIGLDGGELGTVTAGEAASSAARLAGIKAWKKEKVTARKAAAAKKAAADAKAKAEARAGARAAEIEAKRPVPKGVNASRPTLKLGAMRKAS